MSDEHPARRLDAGVIDAVIGAVGLDLPVDTAPHVEIATVDAIRAFARGTGDDNPLFGDEAYGSRSVLGQLVAQPLFPLATGAGAAWPATPGPAHRLVRRLRGLPVAVEGERWMLMRHIGVGTRLERRDTLVHADRDGDDRVLAVIGSVFAAEGVVYAERHRTLRYGAVNARRTARRERHRYTEAEVAAIDQAYASEVRRGAAPLDVADLRVGQELLPLVKGPMTLTDLLSLRAGVGAGPFCVEPLRLGYLNRLRIPEFYDRDESGAFDARERLHWDENYARAHGHPSAYDYTHTRLIWASQLLTNWMGDSGRITLIDFRLDDANYVGDTHWMHGRIDAIGVTGDAATVELSLWGRNQLDVVTCRGTAAVVVPVASRDVSNGGP